MPPVIVNAMDRVKATVKEFSLAQKTLVIIGVAVLALGGFVLYSWIGTPEYKTLFTGLTAKDQAAVTTQLDSASITYKVGDGTIAVPTDKYYDAQMSLAEAGLPEEQAQGYTILDNLGVAASDFQQNMAKKRALEGELAKIIGTLEGVESASVSLAIPDKSVWADPETEVPTQASVVVIPKPGTEISSKEVKGIIKLVSYAIPDLKPANVSVVDSSGVDLSEKVQGGNAQSEDFEKRLEQKILAVVEPQVGVGNARVAVSAQLSNAVTESTKTIYTEPEGGIKAINESNQDEKYTGNGNVVGGVLGPDNIGNPNNLTGTSGGNYETGQSVKNNAINTEVTHTTQETGAVLSKSVSVVVNSATARRIDMNELRDLVTAASGVDVTKGDQVFVSRAAFDDTQAKALAKAQAEAKAAEEAEKMTAMIRQAVIAGLIILLLIIVAAVARRRAKNREREALDLGELDQMPEPFTLTPPEAQPLAIAPPEEEPYEEEEEEEVGPDPALLKLEAKRQEIAELALDKPAAVAEQLRNWMGSR